MSRWFLSTHLSVAERRRLLSTGDPVRYGAVQLALEDVSASGIPGALAECGVYRGQMSSHIHRCLPDRRLYLFDTFDGFVPSDYNDELDRLRFKDTSIDTVLAVVGNGPGVVIRQGTFPESSEGLENERFALVMLDFDKFRPTLAALEFFYPRISSGGFVICHDYNNAESQFGVSRAVNAFMADKSERLVGIPDSAGTVIFRRL